MMRNLKVCKNERERERVKQKRAALKILQLAILKKRPLAKRWTEYETLHQTQTLIRELENHVRRNGHDLPIKPLEG